MNPVVPLALCSPIESTQESGAGSQVWGKCSEQKVLGGDCPPLHLPLTALYSGFLSSPLSF